MSIGLTHPGPAALDNEALLQEAGAKVTSHTLKLLERRERELPGAIQSVIVHFRRAHNRSSSESLRTVARNQSNRETRYSIARAHADQVQAGVREFLSRDPRARDCFRGCPSHFTFEPHRMVKALPVTNTLITPATSRLVEELSEREDVLAVQQNFPVRSMPDDSFSPPSSLVPLGSNGSSMAHRDGYTWGWKLLNLPLAHQRQLTGRNVTAGLINTGVCEDHPDLVFKIRDFAKVEPSGRLVPAHSFDLHGHGTHCAGIMVGAGNSGVQIGGAPDTDLKAVSIMDSGRSYASSLLAALNWLAHPIRSVDVINLAVGFDEPSAEERLLLESVIGNVTDMGIVCVAAIGNSRDQSMYPARLDGVIGCGALAPDRTVAACSGEQPDFVLPGVCTYSCLPPNNPDLGNQSYGWYEGSSCACAHMTGLVALFLQARRDASPAFIFRAFRETASRRGSRDTWAGYGIPDLLRAIEY